MSGIKHNVLIPCTKLRIGQFDRDESYEGDAQVKLFTNDRVQIGGEDGGMVFSLVDLQNAVEILRFA